MANAPMIGLMRIGAGLMIGTTTDAIHAHYAADAIPNSSHEAVRISAAGLLKVRTPIYRKDSGGRRSQRLDAFWSRHP